MVSSSVRLVLAQGRCYSTFGMYGDVCRRSAAGNADQVLSSNHPQGGAVPSSQHSARAGASSTRNKMKNRPKKTSGEVCFALDSA